MSRAAVLILYSRPHCHLCEVAKAALRPILRRHGVALQERDVDADGPARARFGDVIPVGVLDGRVLFKVRFDPQVLERRIEARLRASRRQGHRAGRG